MSEYVTNDGDHVTAKGLTLTVEFGERTKNEIMSKVEEVREENAKLRELAAEMYRLMDESCAVQHPYAPEPIGYDTLLDVHEKLRELRIEVNYDY